MTGSNDSPTNPTPARRRSSFAGQTFADLFGGGRQRPAVGGDQNGSFPNQHQGPISSAAAQASRRRMSLSAMGLSCSPNQPLPFNKRHDSISSANSGSIDESAIEDDGPETRTQPTSPFARRMSFGARALREVKTNAGGGTSAAGGGGRTTNTANGRASIAAASSPSELIGGVDGGKKTRIDPVTTAAKGRGDGYNWADNFRSRAERSSSIASSGGGSPNLGSHNRAQSVAAMQQPPAAEMPKPNVPDHFQERILKGDFYMD